MAVTVYHADASNVCWQLVHCLVMTLLVQCACLANVCFVIVVFIVRLPPLIGGHQVLMLSVWRLSVAYINLGLSWEQRGLGRLKLAQRVAHITRDSDTTFKVRRSKVNLFDGQKGIVCAHILLCFALLWQCRHKLGKIAQCLFLVLLLFVF